MSLVDIILKRESELFKKLDVEKSKVAKVSADLSETKRKMRRMVCRSTLTKANRKIQRLLDRIARLENPPVEKHRDLIQRYDQSKNCTVAPSGKVVVRAPTWNDVKAREPA